MTERTNEEQRLEFYRRNVRGETYEEIAAASRVSVECVRYWCRKQKKGQGVKSQWHVPKRGVLSQFEGQVIERVRELREQHPGWGPVSLRMHLDDPPELKGKRLPSPASIGRWLHEDPKNRRHPKRKPPECPVRVLERSHQRWEIDFKVKIKLSGGETVQLHTVTDPYSGAHIGAYLYDSKPNTTRVPLLDVQTTLRACFREWGTLPEEVQTDGEPVLAATRGELPTDFTLWLAGLGITHRVIPAGRPTANGSVERAHRTLNEYSLSENQERSKAELQTYLHQCREELNLRYPSRAKGCAGKPPLLAHPELLQGARPYQPQVEESLFDLGKVDGLLAACPLERKVGKMGQITIRGETERYFVGRKYAGQFVEVRFDPTARDFVAYLPDKGVPHQEIARWPARRLAAHDLLWPGQPLPIHCPQQLLLPFPGDRFAVVLER